MPAPHKSFGSASIYPECFMPVKPLALVLSAKNSNYATFGHCASCGTGHGLPAKLATPYGHQLIQQLTTSKRLDYKASTPEANPNFSTAYLFGKARGQMFGILLCRHPDGTYGLLYAFSGQYNGHWLIKGWVPPLFEVSQFDRLCIPVDKEIKALGAEMENLTPDSTKWKKCREARKSLSQQLMKQIHSLYEISNFKKEKKSIFKIFRSKKGIPTGAGDCCAPKLLNYAACNNLDPISLAEFYWGQENLSKTREHGKFYSACQEKCQPMLGFMLCGLPKINH